MVSCCYDHRLDVAPIKAAEKASRKASLPGSHGVFDTTSCHAIPTGGEFLSYLRAHNNRDDIAAAICKYVFEHRDGKGRRGDIIFIFTGIPWAPPAFPIIQITGGNPPPVVQVPPQQLPRGYIHPDRGTAPGVENIPPGDMGMRSGIPAAGAVPRKGPISHGIVGTRGGH